MDSSQQNAGGSPGKLAGVPASPLERFTTLLGEDVFFVPCKWGTKKPLATYVERSAESTKTPTYRALFQAGQANIAVYLGKASGGLCAIDFDADSGGESEAGGNDAVARQSWRNAVDADGRGLPGKLQP
jgi:hypothetical protein